MCPTLQPLLSCPTTSPYLCLHVTFSPCVSAPGFSPKDTVTGASHTRWPRLSSPAPAPSSARGRRRMWTEPRAASPVRDTVQGAVLTQAERAGCSCGHRAGCASATWHHHSPPGTLPVTLCAGPSAPSALSWHVPCPERTRWPWLPVLCTVTEELLPDHCLRVPLWAWGGAVCPLAAVQAERCHCRRG